jgi:hypothetical protein
MVLPLVARALVLSTVILIQGASQAVVLSDITTAAGQAGKLFEAFVRRGTKDRALSGATRPEPFLPGRKLFVAAQLFTVGSGELFLRALLAAG